MRATASLSALLTSPCVRWAAAEAVWYDESFSGDTTKRDKGTDFHNGMDAHARGGAYVTADHEVAYWLRNGRDWFDKLLAPRCQTIQTELVFGINFATGEAVSLSTVKNREYPQIEEYRDFLWGTADTVAILVGGPLLIADYKTGKGGGTEEQLLTLANAAQRCMLTEDGTKRPVRISGVYVRDGKIVPEERAVLQSELDAHYDGMSFAVSSVGTRMEPVPGVHCTALYCPHLAHCPATHKAVDELVPAQSLVKSFRMTERPYNADHAGWMGERLQAAKRQLAYYTDTMKAYVNAGGIVRANGYIWDNSTGKFLWRKDK